MLLELRHQVLEAIQELIRRGLVRDTFRDGSRISRAHGLVVIKPRGVPDKYELNTDNAIVHVLRGSDSSGTPAALVANHAAFAWGEDAATAADHALMVKSIARMAYFTPNLNATAERLGCGLHDNVNFRKHGISAYCAQPKGSL